MRKFWIVEAPPVLCGLALLTSCSNFNTVNRTSFLYVASGAEPVMAQPDLTGYAIAPNGTLTWLPCAPIAHSAVYSLVGYGSLVFTTDGDAISVYTVDHSGCLTQKSVTNEDLNTNLNGCYSNCFAGGPLSLFLDPQNQNLYSWNYLAVDATVFASYTLDSSMGTVTRTGIADGGYPTYPAGMLAFSPDGTYAVSATDPLDPSPTGIRVYQRLPDGTLHFLNAGTLPAVDPGDEFYPSGATSDLAGHFIVAGNVGCVSLAYCPPAGPWRLAIYTMDSSGNLTTQSTGQNMPAPSGLSNDAILTGYGFSPGGRFFAFGGYLVIDVYRWDPASATLTFLATIQPPRNCTSDQPCPGFHNFTWDRYDHLIATWGAWVDANAQIQVYSVTTSGIAAAPGSPYPLPSANMLTAVNADR